MGVNPLEEQARPSADFSTLAPAMDSAASGNEQWENTTERNIFVERQARHYDFSCLGSSPYWA